MGTRGRRDRITPAFVAVTVVLAIGVGIIVYLAETTDDTGQPSARATAGATASDAPAGAVLPPSTAPSSARPDGPRYRCWDGTAATSLRDCTDPAGDAALAWIFPQEADARQYGTCYDKAGAARSAFVQCDLRWNGHVVHLHFSDWTSVRRARGHYDGGGAIPTTSERVDGSTLITWLPRKAAVPFADAPWKVAEMLSGRPWTLAAYADDRTTAEAALGTFGEIRDVRQWRGIER